MNKSIFKIDNILETDMAPCDDYLIRFSTEEKEKAQTEIDKLSKEIGFELGMEPKHV